MKKISLSQGKYALVDDEDFEHLSQFKWSYHSAGYAFTNPGSRGAKNYMLMHRVVNNTPPRLQTDHINSNKLDNRKSNLRTADASENKGNKPKQSNNLSGYKSVSFNGGNLWQMRICYRGKKIREYYKTPEGAAIAYNRYAKKLFGEFAFLNKLGEERG